MNAAAKRKAGFHAFRAASIPRRVVLPRIFRFIGKR